MSNQLFLEMGKIWRTLQDQKVTSLSETLAQTCTEEAQASVGYAGEYSVGGQYNHSWYGMADYLTEDSEVYERLDWKATSIEDTYRKAIIAVLLLRNRANTKEAQAYINTLS